MLRECNSRLCDRCTFKYFWYCSSLNHARSRDTCEQPLDYGDLGGGVKRARYERYERWNGADEEQEGTVTFSLISTSFFTVKVCVLHPKLSIIRVRLCTGSCFLFVID